MMWNWGFSNSQRQRIGIALGVVLLVTMLANWFVGYTMQQVDTQFKSVYQDRLVPTAYMSDILERAYQNQLLLEQHLHAGQQQEMEGLQRTLAANNAAIASIIHKFEATYLTEKEAVYLAEFKKSLSRLQRVQGQIAEFSSDNNKTVAQQLYEQQNKELFNALLIPLHSIIKLQEEVGHELYLSADRQVKTLKVLSYVVIAIAVFIALIIGTLLQTNRKMRTIKPQKYQLN